MAHNIVLRWSPSVPPAARWQGWDGRWLDAASVPVGVAQVGQHAYASPAEPTRYEHREDGETAEVWEIHLIEPDEPPS